MVKVMHGWLAQGKRLLGRTWRNARAEFGKGFCPLCECRTAFLKTGPWLRDQLLCVRCRSIPRNRALMRVLQDNFPGSRDSRIHESSPYGPLSEKLARECPGYVGTHFYPNVARGLSKGRFRSEDLEQQTFFDEAFDLVVTSDVFEHVMNPAAAFAEIARTLVPGSAHVFTAPWYYWKPTLVRAECRNGEVVHLSTPDYHGNPIDASGSLVVTEWGRDFPDFIDHVSGLVTEVVHLWSVREGIDVSFGKCSSAGSLKIRNSLSKLKISTNFSN